MKKITIFLLLFTLLVSSCKEDFLDEETKSIATNETFYSTIRGLENLVVAAYVSNKIWYAKEEGFDFSDVGTDIYTYGQQHPNKGQFTFDQTFNALNGRITVLWVEFYKGINACNEALKFLDDSSHPMSDEQKAKRKAEVLFLRSHYFYLLTEIWGDVPMPLTPTEKPTTTASKVPVKAVYTQIQQDLATALSLFKPTDNMSSADYGRVNVDAVRALRARINLTMASYINRAGNPFGLDGNATDYYAQALADANEVIGSGRYSFYSSYDDLWKLDNNTTVRNKEGIWGINYSRGIYSMININLAEYQDYFAAGQKPFDEREGGHHGHLMWGTQYDFGNGSGMVRDITYGRPFRRYAPNKYLIDQFNTALDARFAGQFRTSWNSNSTASPTSATFPKWSDFKLPAGFVPPGGDVNAPVFKKGDTAMVITNKNYPNDRIVPNKNAGAGAKYLYLDGRYLVWDIDLIYNADGSINDAATDHNWFIQLKKFDDPGRPVANGTGSQNGARDAFAFRLAEMYLIAAEAATELGQNGYQYLLTLANTRAFNKNGAELLLSYGISGAADITFEKLLDERAREFPGEQLRWFDLKRLYGPEQFTARIKQFNFDADNIKATHYVRPIPQIQLDAIENASEFGQNPGY
jgi:starch-binding outer membrane protein, SusD/RagB family